MDVALKIAKQRLSVLELAEQLGSVSEACRRRGMDRTSFYEWKRRFQTHGLEGLKDLPPIHKSHPQTVKPEVQARIVELALAHPSYGCNKIEKLLSFEGPYVSNVTIQKILIEHGLGSRYDRWLALEKKAAEQSIELSSDQIAFIEKQNPSFKERHVESAGPGQLLCQDCLMSTEFPWNYHEDFPLVINRNSLVSSSACLAGGFVMHLLPQAESQLQPLSLVLPCLAQVAA